jgi:hypothetical protein
MGNAINISSDIWDLHGADAHAVGGGCLLVAVFHAEALRPM